MDAAIHNFLVVDDRLWTGGQPGAPQLEWLAAHGCEIVVNLGLDDSSYALPDEAGLVQRLGMRYVYLPVDFDRPRGQDFRLFCARLDACGKRKTFVHCAANKRVTVFVALYGQLRWGWPAARADALIARIWEPDATWERVIASIRLSLPPEMPALRRGSARG